MQSPPLVLDGLVLLILKIIFYIEIGKLKPSDFFSDTFSSNFVYYKVKSETVFLKKFKEKNLS